MSLPDREVERLVAALRDGPVALRSAEEAQRRRQHFLHGLRSAAQRVPARRRKRQLARMGLRASALAAALLACTLGGWWAHDYRAARATPLMVESAGAQPLLWIDEQGQERVLAGLHQLAHKGELRVPDAATAHLITHDRVRIDVAGASRLRIDHRERRGSDVFLERGEVHCRVPRLEQGREFAVVTPAARIIVHGTEFTIRVGEQSQSGTCVRVREGLVEIRQGELRRWLGPGTEWGCEEPRVVEIDEVAGDERAPARASETGVRRSRERAPRGTAVPAARGTLSVENELLSAALRAEQEGQLLRATKLFRRLLRSYPDSPLAPEAAAGLARLR